MTDRLRFWDGLVFAFAASMMLWRDLPLVAAILVLTVLVGTALALLTRGLGHRTNWFWRLLGFLVWHFRWKWQVKRAKN